MSKQSTLEQVLLCLKTGHHALIEGPVGSGKTTLALAAAEALGRSWVRVDADRRMTETSLTGWFEPARVQTQGFIRESFIEGPLVRAMETGGVLFLNELNRLPESAQNVLLSALDEKRLELPRLGAIEAVEGFAVIATQNPAEYIGTGALGEAVRDRFEGFWLDYPEEAAERAIYAERAAGEVSDSDLSWALGVIRKSRLDKDLQRGASLRAGIAWVDLMRGARAQKAQVSRATLMTQALIHRLELDPFRRTPGHSNREALLQKIQELLGERVGSPEKSEKKKHP